MRANDEERIAQIIVAAGCKPYAAAAALLNAGCVIPPLRPRTTDVATNAAEPVCAEAYCGERAYCSEAGTCLASCALPPVVPAAGA